MESRFFTEISDLRSIGNLATRRAPHTERQIKCVFLVHAIESFDAIFGVWDAMRNDNRFDPLVVSINRKFPGDTEYRGEDETSAALDLRGIEHIRLGMEPSFIGLNILRALAPDVIFRQSQWEPDVPEAFRTQNINFARLCSVPYGMSTVGHFELSDAFDGGVSEYSFDQLWHRMAWRVFCETEKTRDYFVHFRHSDPSKFIVSGYPKLARLLAARNEPEVWPINVDGNRRFRVIWAPHYSVGTSWLGFGTFDSIHNDFLAYAQERNDIDFVLKPHPALFTFAVNGGAMDREVLDTFLESWKALENCSIELGTYAHLFAASDMMVTDGLSFLTEYPIFEKPLVFIDSGKHVSMNALGEASLAAAHHVQDFSGIRHAIEYYATGGTWLLESERKNLIEILFPREQPAVEIILDEIHNGIITNYPEII